jgi:hypothetical protein
MGSQFAVGTSTAWDFGVSAVTRAITLFGGAVDSKVSGENSTGVHFCTQPQRGHFRFLLLADSNEIEPKEPTDAAGWLQKQEKSNVVQLWILDMMPKAT